MITTIFEHVTDHNAYPMTYFCHQVDMNSDFKAKVEQKSECVLYTKAVDYDTY